MVQKELIKGGAISMLLQYVEDKMNDNNLSLMAANAISCLLDVGMVLLHGLIHKMK
jgi:hypothetical protein